MEHREAQYTLLYKDLLRGHYGEFVADVKTAAKFAAPVADSNQRDVNQFSWAGSKDAGAYLCPALKDVAVSLAADSKQAKGLICLGEFVRIAGLDGHDLNTQPDIEQLGGTQSEFGGTLFSRLQAYKLIIANPKSPAEERAYALYRAVNCYAPSAYNSCGGIDVPIGMRAKWFKMLKTDYPASSWAKRLKYYW
jgi:hypothetical protein